MKFANVSCSHCGQDFGPGNEGYSHCQDHQQPVDLQARINTDDKNRVVYVDQFDDGLWLSIQLFGGGAYCSMSREQAQQLAQAINRVLEAGEQ